MIKQRQAVSWRRALLLLLAGACLAWLQGCATKPQAQYKVYFCNMETTLVSEIRVNYGVALWAIPPLPAHAKGGDERCLGGYAITTMEVLPEGIALKWALGGRRYEVGVPIKSRLNGIYPTGGIQVVFQNNRVNVFEYVYPTNNHLMRLRIYPPVAPKAVPGPKKSIQVTGNGAEEEAARYIGRASKHSTRPDYPIWQAFYQDLDGKRLKKTFSESAHGQQGAHELALQFRRKGLERVHREAQKRLRNPPAALSKA